jgi:26S proteasome regulatory subunit N12
LQAIIIDYFKPWYVGLCYQIFKAKKDVPAPSYSYFLDILVDTIRDEIAACMEKSFDKIHFNEAAKMLSITNINTMKEYGNTVRKNCQVIDRL